MIIRGEKPAAVVQDTLVGSKDGFQVFTNPDLQAKGIGYVIRWRVGSEAGNYGEWRTPAVNWPLDSPSPISAGVMFYRLSMEWTDCITTLSNKYFAGFSGYAQWAVERDKYPLGNSNFWGGHLPGQQSCWVVWYGPQVEVRYLLLTNAASIWNSQLDPSSTTTVTPTLAMFHPRSDATDRHTSYLNQALTIRFLPWATCTTGNVVVPLGTHYPADLPSVGSPSTQPARPFEIKLTNCLRVNIGYSFAAPVSIGFDDMTGVVDLDSTPGNAQGVGIQLRHRNDPQYGNNTIVFNPSDYTTNPSYVRNWPQCQAQGTCTNSSTGVNHTIPMQAAVYRTGNVTPGSINASVLVHIVYP